eukprot:1898870-Alexandrium_andersonii.AAC.1
MEPRGPPPAVAGPCRLVLLSLFDGAGTARLALNVALQHYHCAALLHSSWFVECDAALAGA